MTQMARMNEYQNVSIRNYEWHKWHEL